MKKLIEQIMLDVIQKDGHTDSKSVETSCKVIMSHCQMILDNLTEGELPTWFTNKIAISEYEVVSAANYIVSGDIKD
jgi:hypothetical protein